MSALMMFENEIFLVEKQKIMEKQLSIWSMQSWRLSLFKIKSKMINLFLVTKKEHSL